MMQTSKIEPAGQQHQSAAAAKQLKKNSGAYLTDNRPQSLQQHRVFQLQQVTRVGAVAQLARTKTTRKKRSKRTLSGHGNLRRDPTGVMKYKIPKGKTVMRPAPPGATLGDLSMLLNEKKNLTRAALLRKMKVSTTPDIWRNKNVVSLIKKNTKIPKTPVQDKALDELLIGGYDKLTGGQKGSLARLESKKEFEEWSHSHVKGAAFKTFREGQEMEDMELNEFEPKLRSASPHSDNEYANNNTVLSNYVSSNPDVDDFTVNACSFDEDCPFTGFQLDQKKP